MGVYLNGYVELLRRTGLFMAYEDWVECGSNRTVWRSLIKVVDWAIDLLILGSI